MYRISVMAAAVALVGACGGGSGNSTTGGGGSTSGSSSSGGTSGGNPLDTAVSGTFTASDGTTATFTGAIVDDTFSGNQWNSDPKFEAGNGVWTTTVTAPAGLTATTYLSFGAGGQSGTYLCDAGTAPTVIFTITTKGPQKGDAWVASNTQAGSSCVFTLDAAPVDQPGFGGNTTTYAFAHGSLTATMVNVDAGADTATLSATW
jgi:hypothetical protein